MSNHNTHQILHWAMRAGTITLTNDWTGDQLDVLRRLGLEVNTRNKQLTATYNHDTNKETKPMTSIKQLIEEYIGPRCDEYEPGCVVCDTWQEYDTLVKHQKDHAMEEEMTRLCNWMNSLPIENQRSLMKALVAEVPARLNTNAVSNWINRHPEIVAAAVRDADEMKRFRAEEKAAKRGPWVTPRSIKSVSEALKEHEAEHKLWQEAAANIDATWGMGGPGRGKSAFIKDIPDVKVTKLKKARVRKRDIMGFQTKK